ncbi:MAG: hypothetical protein AAGA96_18340, partial [Verrucomicrobiota bacterium]
EPNPPSNLLHPGHPYNQPDTLPTHGKHQDQGQSEPTFADPSVTVAPVSGQKKKGLFGGLFGGNNKAQR